MTQGRRLLLIYSSKANAFYEGLARRLAVACEENSQEVRLCAAETFTSLEAEELQNTMVAVVNLSECSRWVGNTEVFFSRLSAAQKRVLILAEAIGTRWFSGQFKFPVSFDALVDIGFSSQEGRIPEGFDIPYHFLFNGPTCQEREKIVRGNFFQEKPIPWAVVGHRPAERMGLVDELMGELDPGGFVFLADPNTWVREGHGTISPYSLSSVLSKTKYYVWRTHHNFTYYESLRFIEAILAGAVPCKIDESTEWNQLGIPGVFPSVEGLRDTIQNEGFPTMQRRAREFYLSRGLLSDHLKGVLEDV